MNLVKTVGQPVRDKLMADGVVLAWGVETPLLRNPSGGNRVIWYAIADWSGVENVQTAMAAQLAKIAADEAKPEKGKKPSMTTAERAREVFDASKTRDWLTRDVVFWATHTNPPAGATPFSRFSYVKVKPGKGNDYRKAWEKYNKPVLDKLAADGVIMAFGLAVEEMKTDGDFTHFTWYVMNDLATMEKVRSTFLADRDHRSPEERDAIADLFTSLTDPDAARAEMLHSIIFHLPGQK